MVLHFQALQFAQAGTFVMEISVDEETMATLPLRVLYVPAENGQTA
jgi:hypothetical protein